ncbi:MAG: hypothetical protein ACWGQW_00120 [bacterium]
MFSSIVSALASLLSLINWIKNQWEAYKKTVAARKEYSEQIRAEEEKIKRATKKVTDHPLSDDDLDKRMQDGSF